MTGADWPDPFAEDEAARERERRRAEREARRLQSAEPRPGEQGALGGRVKDLLDGDDARSAAPPPAGATAAAAAAPELAEGRATGAGGSLARGRPGGARRGRRR